MQHDASDGHNEMSTEREEPFAEHAHLRVSACGTGGPSAELLHEHVGGGGQQPRRWFGQKRQQLVRSMCNPSCSSLMRFSMLPRAP